MENSKYDINEIKDKLVKAAEDFSKEYVFKPSDPYDMCPTLVDLKDKGIISEERYNDLLSWLTTPVQTFEIYVEPPKREKK